MSRLKHITFTGVDERTDIARLQELQKRFPMAEFGVLASYHWSKNGNRYPSPEFIPRLRGKGLRLSLHICGEAAHDAAMGRRLKINNEHRDGWDKIDKLTRDSLDIFKRVQLNVSNRPDNPDFCWISPIIGQELIIQQKSADDVGLWSSTYEHWTERPYPHRDPISVLLDASGGRGLDTGIKILPTDGKVGYAGGFNPDNVAEKMSFLLENVTTGEFWIDMENGVRTDDWFDLDKVEKVLEICATVVKKMADNH